MYRKDWVLRMAEGIAAMAASVLHRERSGDHVGAVVEINDAAHRWLGLDCDVIARFSDETLLQMFGTRTAVGDGRCFAAASMMATRAELSSDTVDPTALRRKALVLFLQAIEEDPHWRNDDIYRQVDSILERLRVGDLPEPVLQRLVGYHERAGRYGKAEDALHFARSSDEAGWSVRARAFYERLQSLTDTDLETGGLPRSEVEEALARLPSPAKM